MDFDAKKEYGQMSGLVWSNNNENAKLYFGDHEIVNDNPPTRDYDGVYIDMLLQQAKRIEVSQFLQVFYNQMKPLAKIVVTVPSLEWACRMIATSDNPPASTYICIYGTDEEPHQCGMTVHWLRIVCEAIGFETYMTQAMPAKVYVSGAPEEIQQNIYIGMKPLPRPEEAVCR